jgi:signal transduction histidine kinase
MSAAPPRKDPAGGGGTGERAIEVLGPAPVTGPMPAPVTGPITAPVAVPIEFPGEVPAELRGKRRTERGVERGGGAGGGDHGDEKPREAAAPTPRYPLFSKLLLWFLVIALAPLGMVSHGLVRRSETAWSHELYARLGAVAHGTAERIERYATEQRNVVTALADSPAVVRAFEELAALPRDPRELDRLMALSERLRRDLRYYDDQAGYTNLFLIDLDGNVGFAMHPDPCQETNLYTGPCRGRELAKVFDRAKTIMETELSDFALDPWRGSPAAFVAAPTLAGGKVRGVVALHLSNAAMHHIVNSDAGLGQTGEVVVSARDGDAMVFVTPVRHDPEAAFRRSLPLASDTMQVLSAAVQGVQRAGLMTDYRGVETVAVGRYLPSLRWGMVVKQDVNEAFALMRSQRDLALLTGGVTVIGVILLAFAVARSIAGPIARLTRAVRRIADGDLDQAITPRGRDEIGVLAHAFNAMTLRLRELYATIEQRIHVRTRELEEANAALRRARDAAERASRAKTTFLANMSHELRTPLNAILGYTELLLDEARKRADQVLAGELDSIQQAGQHLLGLVDELLDLARIEAGKVILVHEEVEVAEVVRSAIQVVRPNITRNGNQLVIELAAELGTARLDVQKTRQILINLLGNAAKFTRQGTITVTGQRTDGHDGCPARLSLAVVDTGVGIERARLPCLFEPFETGDASTTRKHGGAGLGLALSQRLAQHMGGRITVSSAPGQGSTFTLELPASPLPDGCRPELALQSAARST